MENSDNNPFIFRKFKPKNTGGKSRLRCDQRQTCRG